MPASLPQRALLGAFGACLAVGLPLEALAGASPRSGSGPIAPPAPLLLAQGLFGLDSESIYSGIRAVNLARNVAVKLNGGLGVYRPQDCMFRSSSDGNGCLVSRGPEGFLFRFLGGAPGWQQLVLPPTVETEILISPSGRDVVNLVYNGAPRSPQSAPAQP
ncbi:MAG: hypothetical protein ACKO5F_00595 [Synechococcus sp.]